MALSNKLSSPPLHNVHTELGKVKTVEPGKPTIPWNMWYQDIYNRVPVVAPGGSLDASKDVQTDSSGFLTSITNTGTVSNVMSDSPTITTQFTSTGTNILSGLTYPTVDGTAGQAIVTDGANTLSWAKNLFDVEAGITAGTTQTQAGGYALTKSFNEVAICATDGNAVTMPSASVAEYIIITNNGDANLQIFPFLGDNFEGVATDASITLPPNTGGGTGANSIFWAQDGTVWQQMNSIPTGYGSNTGSGGGTRHGLAMFKAVTSTQTSNTLMTLDQGAHGIGDLYFDEQSTQVDLHLLSTGSSGAKLTVDSNSANANADAELTLESTAGDPQIRFQTASGGSGTWFLFGRDNSTTGDPLKLSYGNSIGDTNIFRAKTDGNFSFEVSGKGIECYGLGTADSAAVGQPTENLHLYDDGTNSVLDGGLASGVGAVAHSLKIQTQSTDAIEIDTSQDVTVPNLAGAGTEIVTADSAGKLGIVTNQVSIPMSFESYDAEPARGSESNIHGALLSLATGQALNSVPTDLVVTKGIGKLVIVINAGSDFSGSITVTGTSVNRNTGATTGADTDTITVDALTTDTSTTDSNGNMLHAFSGAYITSKWFTGTVTLSTADLTLTDVDVWHCSFEQFNDIGALTLDTFDVNLLTTNANAEFDAYLYCLEVTGTDKCSITRCSSLNVGADGETAIANKYWRLRRGTIAKALDTSTDGVWVDIHYSNSPSYIEDMTMKVWATRLQAVG